VIIECQKKLNITHPSQYFIIGVGSIEKHILCGNRLIARHGGLLPLLQLVFPGLQSSDRAQKGTKIIQSLLASYLQQIFPNREVKQERKLSVNGYKMELDMYIPSLNLAFEYNGFQHYMENSYFGSHKSGKDRDLHKNVMCHKLGITLVTIPYWWDNQISSLKATIHKFRPDLVESPESKIFPLHKKSHFTGNLGNVKTDKIQNRIAPAVT